MKRKWLFYALLASILWAIVNPFIKIGLSYDMLPINFAGLRFIFAGLILFIYSSHKGMFREIKENYKLFILLILVNTFLGYAFFYIGVSLLESTISSIVLGVSPLITAILSHVMTDHDKLTKNKVLSIFISIIGLLMIMGVGSNKYFLGFYGIIGVVLLFLNIILQGYCAIKISKYNKKINPIFLNSVQLLFGGILLYIFALFTEGYSSPFGKPLPFYSSFAILVFISVFAFSFWFMALQDKNTIVSEMNMCRLINPILGAIISWILIPGEVPHFHTVFGMIIISFSLIIYFRQKK